MDPNVKLKLEIERLKIQNKQYYRCDAYPP